MASRGRLQASGIGHQAFGAARPVTRHPQSFAPRLVSRICCTTPDVRRLVSGTRCQVSCIRIKLRCRCLAPYASCQAPCTRHPGLAPCVRGPASDATLLASQVWRPGSDVLCLTCRLWRPTSGAVSKSFCAVPAVGVRHPASAACPHPVARKQGWKSAAIYLIGGVRCQLPAAGHQLSGGSDRPRELVTVPQRPSQPPSTRLSPSTRSGLVGGGICTPCRR
jgi:hypothetical protein